MQRLPRRWAQATAMIALLLFAATASTQAQVYNPANGHYYQVFLSQSITWPDALNQALTKTYLGLQGHLATITDADEDTYVGNAVSAAGAGEFWLGGYQNPVTQVSKTAGWTWVNSEGTFPGVNGAAGFDNSYSNWNDQEPNDAYGDASEQYLGINHGRLGGFNDEGNLSLIGGYVVEFDPNTVPGGGLAPDGGATLGLLGAAVAGIAFYSRRLKK